MTQEDKDLLLKDLCERVSYNLRLKIGNYSDYKLIGVVITDGHPIKVEVIENGIPYKVEVSVESVTPYLRPMSSMTEEEKEELVKHHIKLVFKTNNDWSDVAVDIDGFDWLNTHYFDYRGLIEKGLAIAVTKENNPYV